MIVMKKLGILLILCLSASFLSAQYQSLCWKISGNKLKKDSYLYGTFHIKNEKAFQLKPNAQKAFDDARLVAIELNPEKTLPLSLFASFLDSEISIKKLISDSNYVLLDSIFKKNMHMSVRVFDNAKPILLSFILDEFKTKPNDSAVYKTEFLDLFLFHQAQKQKKKAIGLETVDEQLNALNVLSLTEQTTMLEKSIAAFRIDSISNDFDAMLDYYLKGDLDGILTMEGVQNMNPILYKSLVTDRNKIMAERIPALIKKKASFIAVGALHLPGEDGVITLLRKAGYTVVAMPN